MEKEIVTNVSLPVSLHRRAKQRALDDGATPTFKAVVQKALKEYLAKPRKKGGRR